MLVEESSFLDFVKIYKCVMNNTDHNIIKKIKLLKVKKY